MSYTNVTDVERLLNLTFDVDTKVTSDEVESFVAERESLIDGVLRSQGYETVPADGETDIITLRGMVSKVVAADVYQSWYVRDKLPERVTNWRKDFETFLNMLRQGQIFLVDQSPSTAVQGQISVAQASFRTISWSDPDNYFGTIDEDW